MKLFTFKKNNNKWEYLIDGKACFHFSQTHGVPKEFFNEWVNEMTFVEKANKLIEDWKTFCKENGMKPKETDLSGQKEVFINKYDECKQ